MWLFQSVFGAVSLGRPACSRVTGGGMKSRRLPPRCNLFLSTQLERIGELAASEFRLAEALDRCEIGGLTTNLPLLRHIARHPDFVHNHLNTRWLEKTGLPGFSAQQE